MKIAINTRFLLSGKLEGIGWFTYETLKRICENHPEHEFIFFFDRKYDSHFIFSNNIKPVIIYPPARHPFLWQIWFHWQLPRYLNKYKPDIFLSTDGYLPLKTDVPCLPVIHDINFVHNPQDLPTLVAKYYNKFFPLYAKKAKRIATVSEYSKKDICATFGIEEAKVDVVYNGVNPTFHPSKEDEKKAIKEKHTNGKDYFVFVGAMHPRKNIPRLIEAFYQYKLKTKSATKLVLIGEAMFLIDSIKSALRINENLKEEIIFTGRLATEEIRKLLGGALALTFVPYFEGFGIPILEAIQCNTPVICSNVTSMPEVAGGAALYVDPYDPHSIATAMEEITMNKDLLNILQKQADKQKKLFRWDLTAEKLWSSILKCMEH